MSVSAKKTLIQKKNWIAIFGAPRVILSDNGGEFNNELLRQLCEQFYITINLTEAEAPWTNGSTKWHNDILGKVIVIKKLKLNNNNIILLMSLFLTLLVLKMSYKIVMAFSPNQLVFGESANLPSNLANLPPAMEDVSHADISVKHLNALHAARKAFLACFKSQK